MGDFRFSVNVTSISTRDTFVETCRAAEAAGYDVIMVADHLGMPDPFAMLATAAEVTTTPRLGTFVLNVAFWNPAVLARSVATLDVLSGGRLEVGLGAGYARAEFDQAGVPFGTPGERVDRLESVIVELRAALSAEAHRPAAVQRPHPPLLIGGNGNRVLGLAAEHAAIAGFSGAATDPTAPSGLRIVPGDELDERVAYFKARAGERAAQVELNLLVQQVVVTDDAAAAAQPLLAHMPDATVEQVLALPTFLMGTVEEVVAKVRGLRERYGFTSITVLDPYLAEFAPIIQELNGLGAP
ncbi:TIGR03621 family F420-dependent LLM class oxidoreductase [Pseudonocardia sp. TRM90224]|uniref:TIGR03621 family F420-dependent LLM class oxidoreductase n=1 Tax=Pseudonocardia sp. TRM90224 TaxID=2812678 RepID=UPI001E47269A|nr:TIGR03621 family F420-dependent LLM class oxidoreductase [Pseudonocardia sp. TRM90224]